MGLVVLQHRGLIGVGGDQRHKEVRAVALLAIGSDMGIKGLNTWIHSTFPGVMIAVDDALLMTLVKHFHALFLDLSISILCS